MGVASWLFVVVWAVGGLGRPGGCVRGRQLAVALASRLCGGVGWLVVCWCRRHARCCLFWWWWVLSRAWCLRVWGWHAVGVLGQCALVAWPAFSASLFVGGVGVGVGGLVVNCIVDASILL